jgi:type III restriction enzyme
MNIIKKQIKDRMSLRKPQDASLECLEKLIELIPMIPTTDLRSIEECVKQSFPEFESFERNFPNICFALATGVGKTRLIGAMIVYLAEAKGICNFVILAPNTTITEKLIREFTHTKDPKYVFKGLPDFAYRTPRIVTGENYADGLTLLSRPSSDVFVPESITINIFNIALLHTKDRRIRRQNENVDNSLSYFDYLATRNDLVVFMDEAHHCRAKAGARTIEELNPILGIELTATPQTQSNKGEIPFRNIVYRFTLPEAIEAGYLKRLAIGKRTNIDCSNLSEKELEILKLEDGLTVHRNLQAELWHYTKQRGLKPVKPLLLVIAKDTVHAGQLQEMIESKSFFNGRYADKVLTVHSEKSGEEKEETIRQLLSVESPDNPIEIVIHVHMLKEGWDVNNLYTIVPLRKADSLTLVQQSLGRGARLPFGKRTGIDLIDRLYVVFHDKFDKVIAEAEKYLKIEEVTIDNLPPQGPKQITVEPVGKSPNDFESPSEPMEGGQVKPITPFPTHLPEDGEKKIVPPLLPIKIPRIIIQPDPNARPGRFLPFQLNLQGFGPQPNDTPITFTEVRTGRKEKFHSKLYLEQCPEDSITHDLLDYPDVADTEENASVASDLAQQLVLHLRSYLIDEDKLKLVVHQHRKVILDKIYEQMQFHYEPCEEKIIYSIGKEFQSFESAFYLLPPDEEHRDYTTGLPEGKRVESILWSGFKKSVYPMMKFHSDAERRFASLLESDEKVLHWLKPPKGKFAIHYKKDTTYEPDFVIETDNGKYLCEVKDRTKLKDPIVEVKAKFAVHWCNAANECTDKEWKYLLIPDNAINLATTFVAYISRYEWRIPS